MVYCEESIVRITLALGRSNETEDVRWDEEMRKSWDLGNAFCLQKPAVFI